MKKILISLILLSAATLRAQDPTIVGVSRVQSPFSGGLTVSIFGNNYMTGTRVFFGTTEAEVLSVTPTEIVVRTPAHRIGAVDLLVSRPDGRQVLSPGAFSFINPSENEILLLPLLMDRVPGANGSLWETRLLIANRSGTTFVIPPMNLTVPARSTVDDPGSVYPASGDPNPARLLYMRRDLEDILTLHLRGQDVSRQSDTFGVEIPVVHERDFRVSTLQLVDVPTDSRFRVALRVYTANTASQLYRLRIFSRNEFTTPLVDTTFETRATPFGGAPSQAVPGIYQNFDLVGSFPQISGQESLRIVIEPQTNQSGVVPLFWAMASVAHFNTQHLTLITPE